MFPFERVDGTFAVAAGDPADAQALQAAEIVFGAPFEIVVASFEDIATVLGDKLDAADFGGRPAVAPAKSAALMTTWTICATWRAARPSCVRSTT